MVTKVRASVPFQYPSPLILINIVMIDHVESVRKPLKLDRTQRPVRGMISATAKVMRPRFRSRSGQPIPELAVELGDVCILLHGMAWHNKG